MDVVTVHFSVSHPHIHSHYGRAVSPSSLWRIGGQTYHRCCLYMLKQDEEPTFLNAREADLSDDTVCAKCNASPSPTSTCKHISLAVAFPASAQLSTVQTLINVLVEIQQLRFTEAPSSFHASLNAVIKNSGFKFSFCWFCKTVRCQVVA